LLRGARPANEGVEVRGQSSSQGNDALQWKKQTAVLAVADGQSSKHRIVMSLPVVEVDAPSRLHFGMFSFGQPNTRQFGGVGVMIDRPGLRLRIVKADRFSTSGPLRDRVQTTVELLTAAWHLHEPPACHIEVLAAPPEHVGLGTGTQLALAVCGGVNAFVGREPLDAPALAALAGRGGRSAIGTYGFVRGGFLVEGGKSAAETLSPLEHRVELPEAWRFVLICPHGEQGLSGEAERRAFGDLPPVPLPITRELRREVAEELIPAAVAGQFDRFGQSIYRFGCQAGLCFAARQNGPFAGASIARIVAAIRELGVAGVGQSSWGPTVFALLDSEQAAVQFAGDMRKILDARGTVVIARPNCRGARITRVAAP
jgi:beta-ribofuranosylaminobenzene 5'-phosphate synthase